MQAKHPDEGDILRGRRPAPQSSLFSPKIPSFARLLKFATAKNELLSGDGAESDDDNSIIVDDQKMRNEIDAVDFQGGGSVDGGNENSNKGALTYAENNNAHYQEEGTVEDDAKYTICETTDDSMWGLHTCMESKERVKIKIQTDICYEYDWVLDGDTSGVNNATANEETNGRIRNFEGNSRRKRFGDEVLDKMLGMMELEKQSPGVNSCSSSFLEEENSSMDYSKGNKAGQHAENIDAQNNNDFADFSNFNNDGDDDILDPQNNEKNVISNATEDKSDEIEPRNDELEENANILDCTPIRRKDTSSDYLPPSSILDFVTDLDEKLNVTIEQCLASPLDISAASDDESSNELVGSDLIVPPEFDQIHDFNKQKKYKQPLLMSPMLLESLPVPLHTAASDLEASFTRRIQKNHLAVKAPELEHVNGFDGIQAEDELLMENLADTIHSGYYCSSGDDNDYFDSIVVDEVLNIPWPFHELDLNEPLVHIHDDPDSDGSEDDLNFDSYISNRLSQLDSANGKVVSCILSRVSQKEGAIADGIKHILAVELDIATAAKYADSGREFLQRAIKGYPTDDGHICEYNAVVGGLDVLRYADQIDILQNLLETIDQIETIRDQEVHWWKEIADQSTKSANAIPPEKFRELIDGAKWLKEVIFEEKALSHLVCLGTMRERINGLPEVLLGCIENSFSNLVSRMLNAEQISPYAWENYLSEHDTLLQAWIASYQLVANAYKNASEEANAVAAKWSGCVLEVLCFEINKAFASSLLDAITDGQVGMTTKIDAYALEKIRGQMKWLKFNTKSDSDLASLTKEILNTILDAGFQTNILSFSFFHLCSRLVELMGIYCTLCQWNEEMLSKIKAAIPIIQTGQDAMNTSDNETCSVSNSCQHDIEETGSKHSMMSSISSDKLSSSASFGEKSSAQSSVWDVPGSFEFKGSILGNNESTNAYEFMMKNVQKNVGAIRHALWKCCESSLVQLIEAFSSSSEATGTGERSIDSTTESMRMTYDLFLQFNAFSSAFLDDSLDDICTALETELSNIYRRHLRSVHIDAMNTTGTLLRHDSWQLASLDLPNNTFNIGCDEKKCVCDGSDENCEICKGQCTVMNSIYKAVQRLLLGTAQNERPPDDKLIISLRATTKGYNLCRAFASITDKVSLRSLEMKRPDMMQQVDCCFGMSSKEFAFAVLPFVERKPCGQQTLSLLTQSSANGLVKWTARLLSIGNILPSIANDAAAAVTTLFDLYILTVFRMCARSKMNEDVLIGHGRGASAGSINGRSTQNPVSLTMEADVCAPLPREMKLYGPLQQFITNGRKRLENIVNLDKFESFNDMCIDSPRSKKDVKNVAQKLERGAGAAYSCLLVAILADVASNIFSPAIRQGDNTQDEADDGLLKEYASNAIQMVPFLTKQACRLACVHSISGKELIFQIMCVGRAWEDHNLHESSNAYVDELCERCTSIWGHLSSSLGLPPPVLKFTWEHLLRVAFFSLLEGFSKVPNCSTEGRMLMSMDVATLTHALSPELVKSNLHERYQMITSPSDSCREEAMRYVDTFVKVFYYPDEDILHWIRDNYQDYFLEHSLSLITAKSAPGYQDKSLWSKRKESIRDIYNQLID